MSDDKTTEPATAESQARGAELRENVALTDARRTEEQRAKAEQAAEDATEKAERLGRKERKEREKAERLHAEAERARERTPAAEPVPPPVAPEPGPAATGIPGLEKLPPAAQRTEVLVGAAFVGSFLAARILKRIFD